MNAALVPLLTSSPFLSGDLPNIIETNFFFEKKSSMSTINKISILKARSSKLMRQVFEMKICKMLPKIKEIQESIKMTKL